MNRTEKHAPFQVLSRAALATVAAGKASLPESLLGLTELAKVLSLSTRTIRNHVHSHIDPLPAYLVGGRLLFRMNEVNEWIERRKIKPADISSLVETFIGDCNKKGTQQ